MRKRLRERIRNKFGRISEFNIWFYLMKPRQILVFDKTMDNWGARMLKQKFIQKFRFFLNGAAKQNLQRFSMESQGIH